MNYIKILFGQMAIIMLLLSGILNCVEKHLPIFIVRTFRYGKFACKKNVQNILKPIEVPKSWFKHFYIFSSIISAIALYVLINSYVFKKPVPIWIKGILNLCLGKNRYASVTPAATFLALILLAIQCFRRLYDTHFVSVFSKKSRMNLVHYLVGFVHYAGAILAILGEAPLFSITSGSNRHLKLTDISYTELASTILFLWAWWHQFKVTQILGNLRKNSHGQVVCQKHHIPEGDLFTYISSPHIFTEILMYLSLNTILWQNSIWRYITLWVLANQVETALLSHWWYKETFPNYPKERKILIPYVF